MDDTAGVPDVDLLTPSGRPSVLHGPVVGVNVFAGIDGQCLVIKLRAA